MSGRASQHFSLRSTLIAIALLASVAIVAIPSHSEPAEAAAGAAQASRYIAISPVRILDSRAPGRRFLQKDGTLSINPLVAEVVAAAQVDPLDVEAVAINLTISQPSSAGYLASWPTALYKPNQVTTSVVNNLAANETIANFAIVPVGANGLISVRSLSGSHVVIDVQGVFARSTSSTAGRFVPLPVPKRALDTRTTGQTVAAGTAIVIDLTAAVGIPRTASAGVINLVAADTRQSGYLTAYPNGTPPIASNVNYPGGGYNIAGSAITRLDAGKLTVFASGTTDLVLDVVGYMTGAGAAASSEGLFVPTLPARHYDSRPDQTPAGSTPLLPGQSRAVQIEGQLGIPLDGVLGVAANLTMTETSGPGYLVAYPKDPVPQAYSTVNSVFAGQSIANHAVVALDNGKLSVFSQKRSDFIVDVTGYFLEAGAPVPTAPRRTLTNPAPNPDVVPGAVAQPPYDPDYRYLYPAGGAEIPFASLALNGSRYFGWNPCDPITYAIHSARATQDQVNALNEAIKIVEAATGYDFIYLGEAIGSLDASRLDSRVRDGRTAMAVFGFSDPYATPDLGAAGVIGLGGTTRGRLNRNPIVLEDGDQYAYVVRGGFALADITNLSARDELINTFVHEIGHMVGLDHVSEGAAGEIMRPFIPNPPQDTIGNGDKYGFWSIGKAQCTGLALREAPQTVTATPDFDNYSWIID